MNNNEVEFKKLTDEVSVCWQIKISDVERIKAAGFKAIINNRPDGEVEGQPSSEEIKAKANEAGLDYFFIPLTGRDFVTQEMVEKTKEIFARSNKPIICYCRTGTRSTILWALAQKDKMQRIDIVVTAADAGYDISHLRSL